MIIVTVQRPNGQVERVEQPNLPQGFAASPKLIEKMRSQTRAAGRGDVLSVEWVSPLTTKQEREMDAEIEAYDRWDAARWNYLDIERNRFASDGTGIRTRELETARVALETAKAAYLAIYGEDGASLTIARRNRTMPLIDTTTRDD